MVLTMRATHEETQGGVRDDPNKVKKTLEFLKLERRPHLRTFIDVLTYMQPFISLDYCTNVRS